MGTAIWGVRWPDVRANLVESLKRANILLMASMKDILLSEVQTERKILGTFY